MYSSRLASVVELIGELRSPLVRLVHNVLVGLLAAALGNVPIREFADTARDA